MCIRDRYWRVTDISSAVQKAWQIYAVAQSTTQAGVQYIVRCGVALSNRDVFSLLEMPYNRKKRLSRCSCAAGDAGKSCKHLAMALHYCLPGVDHLGQKQSDVPDEVHENLPGLHGL